MQENMNPYSWQPLNTSELPKERTCRMCGQPNHLIPLNEHIVFWVHRGKELDRCTDIAFRTSYLNNLRGLLQDKKENLEKQISKEEKK
jgi:hypothetical protein